MTTAHDATGQPAMGQPAMGQAAMGQAATDQDATGQPATGQPAMGQPATDLEPRFASPVDYETYGDYGPGRLICHIRTAIRFHVSNGAYFRGRSRLYGRSGGS
jgi:hypothetical protein